MKNRLVSILLGSLVLSLSFALACSGGGGRRRTTTKDGGNNTIHLDGGSSNNTPDLKGSSSQPKPDLSDPGTSTGDLTCEGYFTCTNDCAETDDACFDDCWANTSPSGQQAFSDLFNCLANECVSAGSCEVNSAGTGLVQSTTCSTCLNADETWNACAAEANACAG